MPEFTTIVVNVEATLNSRPLELMDSNPTDGTVVLTPGHFLIGRPLRVLPLAADTTTSRKLLKRWDLVQQILQTSGVNGGAIIFRVAVPIQMEYSISQCQSW